MNDETGEENWECTFLKKELTLKKKQTCGDYEDDGDENREQKSDCIVVKEDATLKVQNCSSQECSICRVNICSFHSEKEMLTCNFCNSDRYFCTKCIKETFKGRYARQWFCLKTCAENWKTKNVYLKLELAILNHDDTIVEEMLFDAETIYAPSYLTYATTLAKQYNRKDIQLRLSSNF
jgi:hypothetical protein